MNLTSLVGNSRDCIKQSPSGSDYQTKAVLKLKKTAYIQYGPQSFTVQNYMPMGISALTFRTRASCKIVCQQNVESHAWPRYTAPATRQSLINTAGKKTL